MGFALLAPNSHHQLAASKEDFQLEVDIDWAAKLQIDVVPEDRCISALFGH